MEIKKATIFFINFVVVFCCRIFCGPIAVQFTTKHNILLTALPRENENVVYKFDGTFYADRMDQLEYIAEEGGSTQSNDCLEYGEFLKLRDGKSLEQKTIEKFEKAVKQMDAKIEKMSEKNQILGAKRIEIDIFKTELNEESKSADKQSLPLHQLVIECKQFMRRLMSEEGEGSWLDIYSFMEAKETRKYGTALRNIFELAKIQSAKLDEMINQAMWEEHKRNEGNKTKKRVLVEGAGPIGLFSAFHLFLAGGHVTVVNDRPERYTRNQMTFFDAKFVAQFRFFLGTKFDELYSHEKALGRINTLDGEVCQQNVKLIEQIFKIRLVELASFVESKGTERPLKLLYQTELKSVRNISDDDKSGKDQKEEGRGGFEAIIGMSSKRIATEQKQWNIGKIEKKVQIGEIDLQTAENKIKLEMEGKASELRPLAPIPFDILFCAGGANDQIRNQLLGEPMRKSITKNYGLVVFEKGNPDEKVFDNLTGFFNVEMSEFEPFLRKQNFDEFVTKQKILPEKIREKYHNLTEMIVRGIAKESKGKYEQDDVDKRHTKPIYKTENGRFLLADPTETQRQIVRLFENRPTIHIASITPPAVEEFVRDIKREWQQLANKKTERRLIEEVRLRFERKWNAAIFDLCLQKAHPEKVGKIVINMDAEGEPGKEFKSDQLNIDPTPLNTSVFPLTIFAVKNAVKVMRSDSKKGAAENGKTAIIAAIGDANTSAHFMTTSGLSTGRLGVEWSAYALRDYHQGKITEEGLIDRMREKLNSIERRVVKKVQEYVTIEHIASETQDNLDKDEDKVYKVKDNLDKDEDKVYKAIY